MSASLRGRVASRRNLPAVRGELRLIAVVIALSLLTLLVPDVSVKLVLLTAIAACFVVAVLVRGTRR